MIPDGQALRDVFETMHEHIHAPAYNEGVTTEHVHAPRWDEPSEPGQPGPLKLRDLAQAVLEIDGLFGDLESAHEYIERVAKIKAAGEYPGWCCDLSATDAVLIAKLIIAASGNKSLTELAQDGAGQINTVKRFD